MFFRIGEERFKMSAVTRFSAEPNKSAQTGKWYIRIWFGARDRLFAFDTEKERTAVVNYLDGIFKVQPV